MIKITHRTATSTMNFYLVHHQNPLFVSSQFPLHAAKSEKSEQKLSKYEITNETIKRELYYHEPF